MPKKEAEQTEWLLNEDSLGVQEYDIDSEDRRRVEGLFYEDSRGDEARVPEDFGEYLDMVSFDEQKLEVDSTTYTALRVYEEDSEVPVAAEVYDGIREDPVDLEGFDEIMPEWLNNNNSARRILDRYQPNSEDDLDSSDAGEDVEEDQETVSGLDI